MKTEKLDKVDEEIDRLSKRRILELLKTEPTDESLKIFYAKLKAAQIGLVYKRDREIMKRITGNQILRVVTLVTSDPQERRKYIDASLPGVVMLAPPES